jgi:RNA polymerase-binding transcription factor
MIIGESISLACRLISGIGVALVSGPVRGRGAREAYTMETIRERLEEDLRTAVGRLRMMGGAAAVEEFAGAIGDNSPYADEVDEIQENERREIGFATRELLVGRVNRLSAALERLQSGDYGTCVECEETISPARLQALPEVTTCVRCQDRLERLGRQFVPSEDELETADED